MINLPFGFYIGKRPRKITAVHPDYRTSIEYAFTLEGFGDLYQFTNNIDMPYERDFAFARFSSEFYNRMEYDDQKTLLKKIIEHVNQGQLSKVALLAESTLYAIDQAIDIETLYRVMSCHYFTLDEPLLDYDYDYNQKKIKAFKNVGHERLAFFLSKAKSGLLERLNMSEKDLQTSSHLTKAKREYLTSILSGKTLKNKQQTGA